MLLRQPVLRIANLIAEQEVRKELIYGVLRAMADVKPVLPRDTGWKSPIKHPAREN